MVIIIRLELPVMCVKPAFHWKLFVLKTTPVVLLLLIGLEI